MPIKYLIKLENIGRGKVNKTLEWNAYDLTDVELKAYKEADKYLMSQDTYLIHNDGSEYLMYAGVRQVGRVFISLASSN